MQIWQKLIDYIKKKRDKGYTAMVVPTFQGTTKSLEYPVFSCHNFSLLPTGGEFLFPIPVSLAFAPKSANRSKKIDQLCDIIARQERDPSKPTLRSKKPTRWRNG